MNENYLNCLSTEQLKELKENLKREYYKNIDAIDLKLKQRERNKS